MRWLILGALLGLLLLYPPALTVMAAIIGSVLSKPAVIVFGLGVAAGLRTPWLRRWAR